MFKRIFTKLKQVHKRRGFIWVAVICLSIAFAAFISILATSRLDLIARDRLITVSIDNNTDPVKILGSGINLKDIPTTNLLTDSSFEPYLTQTTKMVLGGNDKTLIVSNTQDESSVYTESFFVGANARITSFNESSVTLRKTGTVVRYSPDQTGEFFRSPVSGDIPPGAIIKSCAKKAEQTIAVGEKGIIIRNVSSQSPSIEYAGINTDFVCVSSNKTDFFACTIDGLVVSSTDGINWKNWEMQYNQPLNSIAASPDVVVAVGDDGVLLVGSAYHLYKKETGLTENYSGVVYADNKFTVLSDKGSVLTSTNGIIWQKEQLKPKDSYQRIYHNDSLYAVISDRKVLEIFANTNEKALSTSSFGSDIVDVAIISKSNVLVLESNNTVSQSSDYGKTWRKTGTILPVKSVILSAISEDQILCSSDIEHTYIASLVTEIEIDSGLLTGEFEAGDMCFLTMEHLVKPTKQGDKNSSEVIDEWEFYGTGNAEKTIEKGSASGGMGVMKISCLSNPDTSNTSAVISQKITGDQTGNALVPGSFYIFNIWLRNDTLSNQSLKAWITGPFDSIGTEFKNIGTSWKKYTFKFSFPLTITSGQASQARLNLGIEAEGSVYLDNAYLGDVDEQEQKTPGGFINSISSINPALVRLDFLQIGSLNSTPNEWAYGEQLESALSLVISSGKKAAPWIVIDSAISESELRNLIEYLAGPISTIYGKMRLDNGSSLPWSSRFEKVYFEFTDKNRILLNDLSKSSYVNYSIDLIKSTPNYRNLKNKIVFIDGMQYSAGLMLSHADYTASDITCALGNDRYLSIQNSLIKHATEIPRNPERPANIPISLMRSIEFSNPLKNIETADYTALMLDSLGNDVSASLLSIFEWNKQGWSKARIASSMAVSLAAAGEKVSTVITSNSTEKTSVLCYAFRLNSKLSFVFASLSESPSSISLNITESINGARLIRIDADGMTIEDAVLKKSDNTINIMPGHVVVVLLK